MLKHEFSVVLQLEILARESDYVDLAMEEARQRWGVRLTIESTERGMFSFLL